MKKTILCTEDNPLHLQISQEESLKIEELEVSGYLDEDDYENILRLDDGNAFYQEIYKYDGENGFYDVFSLS